MDWRELPVPLHFPSVPTRPSLPTAQQQANLLNRLQEPARSIYRKILAKLPKTDYAMLAQGGGHRLEPWAVTALQGADRDVPSHVYRVEAKLGHHRSSGHDNPVAQLPNAYVHKIPMQGDLTHLTVEDGASMLAAHLKWNNSVQDPFMSYTVSTFFYNTHAVRRHENGQSPVSVSAGYVRRLEKPNGSSSNVYLANTLLTIFPRYKALALYDSEWQKLHHRHFTHEILVNGETRDPHHALGRSEYEHLIELGLWELVPEINLRDDQKRSRLYKHQVGMRNKLFYAARPQPITKRDILLASSVASGLQPQAWDKPPLRVFLDHLAMRKRPAQNPVLRKWIKEHYTNADVLLCVTPNTRIIPVNLPEVKQAVMLLQEAGIVLGVGNVLQGDIEIIEHDGQFKYSEDHLHYTISKPLDMVEKSLLSGNCWRLLDKEARRKLAREWSSLDSIRSKDEPEAVQVKAQATADEDNDSESDEYGDSEGEEELGLIDGDDRSRSFRSDSLIAASSDHCAEKAQQAKSKSRKRKMGVSTGTASPSPKKKKIGHMTIAEREVAFNKKAKRFEKVMLSRQAQRAAHARFERDVKPALVAQLQPGETWY